MEVVLADGRSVRVYDTGSGELTVLWHHGTPQTGVLLDPVVAAAERRGIRLVSYARPSYGGSSPHRGRDVASAGDDVRQIMNTLGIQRFAMIGVSGGGPHALACAAAMPDRVIGVVTLGGMAPYTVSFDWFDGMADDSALRAAANGLEARTKHAETAEFDPDSFTAADWAALEADWESLGADAVRAGKAGPDGQIDDDMAYIRPWGFDVAALDVPVLLGHGGDDRVIPPSHSDWLIRAIPTAELWLRPRDGHISILNATPVAMDWLRTH